MRRTGPVRAAPALALLLVLGLALVGCGRESSSSAAATPPALDDSIRIDAVWAARLPDLAGEEQALAQWRGEVVVLNFWAPWCPPCREEIPAFVRLQERYGERGLRFVGVALDDPVKVAEFADQNEINYPTLLGGLAAVELGRSAGNRLGGLPYTLILDRAGNPVTSITGELSETRLEGLIQPLL